MQDFVPQQHDWLPHSSKEPTTAHTEPYTLKKLHVTNILFRLHYHWTRSWLFRNVGMQIPTTPRNIPEEQRFPHFRHLRFVQPRHLMQWEEKQFILIISSGTMCKRNVNIRKIPFTSRKITDTNDSQITRNFWTVLSIKENVRPSHNVHECRDLLHTYMCMSLSECSSVADSAGGAVILCVSASSEGQEQQNEKF
jgi:hypothetical protein